MDKIKIELFLKTLKESDFFIEHIYTNGGCYQLYKVLKTIYPTALPYFNSRDIHVATLIEDSLYDINGFIGYIEDYDTTFHLMTDEEMHIAEGWSFASNNDLYYGECPVCGEPIRVDRSKLIKQV